MVKIICFSLAWVSFLLGIIGAFLPVLPTTPFLILSAFLFSKSSPRFHTWLLNLPLAGEGIKEWQEHKVIRPRAKILCVTMIFLSLTLIYLNGKISFFIKVPVTLTLVSVGFFVLSRKNEV